MSYLDEVAPMLEYGPRLAVKHDVVKASYAAVGCF